MTELPKTYDPAAVEAQTYRAWLDEKCFHAEASDPGEPYCIVIPPPNVTGALHLGHAINNTLQDILIRKARMEGKNALWIPGLDHAGIATQAVVEKTIKEKEGKDRYSLAATPEASREELVRRIWEWKQQYGDRILSQLQRLGCSCDWDRTRFTLDDMCAKAVRETFFKLFKDGLVYRGKRLVNWDTHLQTSISDDEIYHETVKTNLWHIHYEIVDSPHSTGYQPVSDDADRRKSHAPGHGLVARATENISQQFVEHKVDETTDSFLETFPSDPGSDINLPNDNEPDPAPRPTHVTVATTRPETLLGDTAVAVNSADPRWNWAIGKQVRLPLLGRLIPIIADDILVDPKFGTGVVKVTPAHDPNDYAVWQRHQKQPDQIDLINLLNPDGTLNDAAGPYKGLPINKARTKVIDDLKSTGLLVKEEPYETEVGHSDRSKTPIQPYLSDQWFVKMAPLAEPALQVVRDGTIQFFPERHAQQYLSWLGEKRDWPISRQLWWGHRIPVWTMLLNGRPREQHEPITGDRLADQKYDAAAKESLLNYFTACGIDVESDFVSFPIDGENQYLIRFSLRTDRAVAAIDAFKAMADSYELQELKRGVELQPAMNYIPGFENATPSFFALSSYVLEIVQDPDVLDTWFSSALWPHSTLGWPEKTPELAKWYPTSVLLTGRDIITLWVARMVMMGMYNMGSKDEKGNSSSAPFSSFSLHPSSLSLGIPFYHVAINPTILDGRGERMSKSKGNGVDPVDVIDTHGADALRFTLATMATETQDVRMPVKKDAQGRNTSDKFDLGRNFCNKLWNASRFVLATLDKSKDEGGRMKDEKGNSSAAPFSSFSLHPSALPNRWIISRFNQAVVESNKALAVYRFDLYAKTCYDFVWRDFCDWYLESTKVLLKSPAARDETLATLTAVLDGSLRLLHPVIPFITETIWSKLNEVAPSRPLCGQIEKRIMLSQWPADGPTDDAADHVFTRMQNIIVAIRNLRNEHNVDARKPVTVSISAPGEQAVAATNENRELIESLATCTVKAVGENLPPPAEAIRVTVNGNGEIYLEGLVDPAAESQRVQKRIAELTREIATLTGRLANEGYVAKAPPKLIQETRDKLAAAEAELKKLKG